MHDAILLAVPADIAALFARSLLAYQLDGRQLQDRFDAGPAGDVDDLRDLGLRFFDQLDHGQKVLTFTNQELGEFPPVSGSDDLIRFHWRLLSESGFD